MIGVDTNVLVRYLMQDDDSQSAAATVLVESLDEDEPGYVSIVVLVELVLVLRRMYRVRHDEVLRVLQTIVSARDLVVQEADSVRRALARCVGAVELPDALIAQLAHDAGCARTVTFDRSAARSLGLEVLAG